MKKSNRSKFVVPGITAVALIAANALSQDTVEVLPVSVLGYSCEKVIKPAGTEFDGCIVSNPCTGGCYTDNHPGGVTVGRCQFDFWHPSSTCTQTTWSYTIHGTKATCKPSGACGCNNDAVSFTGSVSIPWC